MLNLKDVKVYIHGAAIDMRGSFDRLALLAGNKIFESKSLFVFFGKNKKRVKILYWDKDGYALWYKRLEKGTFKFSEDLDQTVTGVDLKLLLSGMEFSRINIRKRYS
jgi:transposase